MVGEECTAISAPAMEIERAAPLAALRFSARAAHGRIERSIRGQTFDAQVGRADFWVGYPTDRAKTAFFVKRVLRKVVKHQLLIPRR
jgi:hypothetical protein